ncbi:FERM domain-containing protein 6 [Misgurnus anguillicaudatus]|uniref:FERM domain-containing protein 6 n=1 Tax=Misgurnus anguillicaudatus TaxID=75329 RepID=UPI003CCF08BD
MAIMKNQERNLCVVLPNNTQLNITVGVKGRGQDVINKLSDLLDITELHLFGLSLIKDNQLLFLDLEQKLSMYLPKSWRKNTLKHKVVIHLRVQYFVENANLILNDEACKLYYAEIKSRVLGSMCYDHEGLYFQLAAYALQAELGDYKQGNIDQPQDFFPLWIIQRRGRDFILEHTPALHKEITGMSSSKAARLFIQNAFILNDVPVTIYTLFKGKRKQGGVVLSLASTGLQISEMLNGEQQFLYDLAWSSIHSITFQGRKLEICDDALHGGKVVFYSLSVLHAKHLLQHISNNHRLHLNTKRMAIQCKETNETDTYREMYVTDDMNIEESDDELPPMKFLLANAKNILKDSDITMNSYGLEMSVDEPVEMLVDDPEDVLHLFELLEGESVDDPCTVYNFH